MKNTSKGFIGIIVIVLIVLAVLGGGAYLYTTQKTLVDTALISNQPIPSSTTSTTSSGVQEQNQNSQMPVAFSQYNFSLKNTPDYTNFHM